MLVRTRNGMYIQSVESKFSHKRIDRLNAEEDRRIASRLRADGRLLALARQNLERWKARDGRKVRRVFQEWHLILTRLSRAEISEFLRSDTPMARRLRQSSPFACLMSATKRRRTRLYREKA